MEYPLQGSHEKVLREMGIRSGSEMGVPK